MNTTSTPAGGPDHRVKLVAYVPDALRDRLREKAATASLSLSTYVRTVLAAAGEQEGR